MHRCGYLIKEKRKKGEKKYKIGKNFFHEALYSLGETMVFIVVDKIVDKC
jgi:hypothetical protein